MEMCYDGALVMPSSYAVMDEEEMTYTEGGEHARIYLTPRQCADIAAGGNLLAMGIAGLAVLPGAAVIALAGSLAAGVEAFYFQIAANHNGMRYDIYWKYTGIIRYFVAVPTILY